MAMTSLMGVALTSGIYSLCRSSNLEFCSFFEIFSLNLLLMRF